MKAIYRIKKLIDIKGDSISGLEKSIGLGNQTLARALERGSGIKDDVLNKILNRYNDVNPVWLLTGNGEIFINTKNEGTKGKLDPEKMELLRFKIKTLEEKLENLEETKKFTGKPIQGDA